MKKTEKTAAARRGSPDPSGWAALAALGAASALWSSLLWAELVIFRSGGGSFCSFGGRFDCAGVWNGALASAVHEATGLPIAGWGLAWSAVAFALALSGLARLASGGAPSAVLVSAVRMTAGAGVLTVAGLAAASLAAGTICVGCVGTYLFVGAYGVIALWSWRAAGLPQRGRAAALSLGCAAAAFLLLLYPGLRTPKVSGEAGRRAVAEAAAAAGASEAANPEPPRKGTGDPRRDRAIEELVASLDPVSQQTLADSLAIFRASPPATLPPPRDLVGSTMAPVRITEFTDILCEHCAGLYETLQALRTHTSPGSFSIDARQYPLDGRCNPRFVPGQGDDVRCAAAAARLCVGPTGREPEFAGALFANQKGLTRAKVLDLAAPYVSRDALTACLAADDTRAKLEQDIAAASQYDSDGTPIVAINGRRATSFAPFLYAMILARGNADHPAFDVLPPGNPTAHLH